MRLKYLLFGLCALMFASTGVQAGGKLSSTRVVKSFEKNMDNKGRQKEWLYVLQDEHATPTAGTAITYFKTDKKKYMKDDTGLETELSATPGTHPVNLQTDVTDEVQDENVSNDITVTGMLAFPTDSAGLAASVTDETGTGLAVFNDEPTFQGTVIISDSATKAPIRFTERSAAPSAPVAGDVYMDDGTSTGSGNPGLRRYTGAVWEDVDAGTHTADTNLTQEEVEDISGGMIATGGTKTGIAVTYQDSTNDMDMVVDHDAATNFVSAEHLDWATSTVGTIHATNYVDVDTFVTNKDSHDHKDGDGEQIDHTTASNIGSNSHSTIDTHLGASNPHSGSAASGVNTDITSIDIGGTTVYSANTITQDTGAALNIVLSGSGGDDFTVDTDKLVVEGDTGNVGIGTVTPRARLEIRDQTGLASESLQDGNFSSFTNWTEAGDMAEGTNNYVYAHSGGTGSLTQSSGDLTIAGIGDRWYKLQYTISNVTETGALAATLTTAFAGSAVNLIVDTETTQTHYFTSKTSPGDFVISVTSDTASDTFTIDDVTLKEITGGDVIVNGIITGGGSEGIKVLANGNVGIGTVNPTVFFDINKNQNLSAVMQFKNATNGTLARTLLLLGSNAGSLKMFHMSSGYTTTSRYIADSALVEAVDSSQLSLSVNTNVPIVFYRAGDEQMRLSATGKLGIGLNDPGEKLSVAGNVMIGDAGWSDGTTTGDLAIQGNVGIGVTDPDTKLEVLGSTGIKISFDGTDNATLVTDTNGDLTIKVSGSQVIIDGNLAMVNDKLILRDTNAGITASTTQAQGQGALTAEINEISTVANPDDTVTLHAASAGITQIIINKGANTLQIFPASGDDLGSGVDVAQELESNEDVIYVAYDATTWTKVASTEIIHTGMLDEDNTDAFVINDAGADFHCYHTNGMVASDLAGWIFDIGGGGTSFPIASIVDGVASGVDIEITTTGSNLLAVGDIISQTNLADAAYVGIFKVKAIISATQYEVAAVFTATGTGTMDQAAVIIADTGSAGVYSITWGMSATSATNNETFDFRIYKDATRISGMNGRRKFGTAADFGMGSPGTTTITIADGDKVSFALSNENSAGNITIRNFTMNLIRL